MNLSRPRQAGSASLPAMSCVSRSLQPSRKRGAEVLFVPAGWVCGENKPLHWNTLLCARAIENGVTVIGADQYRADHFIGHSAVFAPDGTTLASLGAGEGLLVTEIAGTEEEEEGEEE